MGKKFGLSQLVTRLLGASALKCRAFRSCWWRVHPGQPVNAQRCVTVLTSAGVLWGRERDENRGLRHQVSPTSALRRLT